MRIDVHQHLWTEPLVAALSRRTRPPFVGSEAGKRVLYTAEGSYPLERGPDAVDRRATAIEQDGLDQALVCLSSPAGIEALPRDEAEELIAAYAEGVAGLPEPFGAWGRDPTGPARS